MTTPTATFRAKSEDDGLTVRAIRKKGAWVYPVYSRQCGQGLSQTANAQIISEAGDIAMVHYLVVFVQLLTSLRCLVMPRSTSMLLRPPSSSLVQRPGTWTRFRRP